LLFCQTVVNALAAGISEFANQRWQMCGFNSSDVADVHCTLAAVLVTGAKSTTSPLPFAPLGLVYILAMFFSNLSLQYIDYPSQVLGKSCKPLAVLLVGTLVWRIRRFPKRQVRLCGAHHRRHLALHVQKGWRRSRRWRRRARRGRAGAAHRPSAHLRLAALRRRHRLAAGRARRQVRSLEPTT
jgi:hypothetical protein